MIIVQTVPTNKLLGERAVLVSRMTWTSPSGLAFAPPTVQRISDTLPFPRAGGGTAVEGAVLAPPPLAAVTLSVEAGAVEETSRVARLGGAVHPLPSWVALAFAILAFALLSTPWLARRWREKIASKKCDSWNIWDRWLCSRIRWDERGIRNKVARLVTRVA